MAFKKKRINPGRRFKDPENLSRRNIIDSELRLNAPTEETIFAGTRSQSEEPENFSRRNIIDSERRLNDPSFVESIENTRQVKPIDIDPVEIEVPNDRELSDSNLNLLENLENVEILRPVQGDILYFDAAKWVKLPPGTDGRSLRTNGTGANPAWEDVAHSNTTGRTANDHHNESHTVASHSDTTGTGTELNTLTDGSTTTLHSHAGSKISIIYTDVTVANTTTETNLIAVSIPGNTLGTVDGVKVRLYISNYTDDAGGSDTCTVRVKYGATTITTQIMNLNNGTNRPGFIDILLLATGATNSQELSTSIQFSVETLANGTFSGMWDLTHGTAVEDSTGALDLDVSVQWANAQTANTITMSHAIVERIF